MGGEGLSQVVPAKLQPRATSATWWARQRPSRGTGIAEDGPMHIGFRSRVRLVGWLVPVVSVAALAVPRQGALPVGIPEALGCSGAGSVAMPGPWRSLVAADADAKPSEAVLRADTDGFVVLTGTYSGLTSEEALASIRLVVTDSAGNEVPGSVASLATTAVGDGFVEQFGWTATTPLAVGTRLTAQLGVTPTLAHASHTYSLEVVGPAAAPPMPAATFSQWADVYNGTGEPSTCATSPTGGSCSPTPPVVQVYSAYELTSGQVRLDVELPMSGVAWLVTAAESATHPETTLGYGQERFITGPNSDALIGTFSLATKATEACALVTIKDLRTGKSVSTDTCAAREPAKFTWAGLGSCAQPPNEALRDLWCKARTSEGMTCDAPTTPTTGSAGSAGLAGSGSLGGSEGLGGGPPETPGTTDDANGSESTDKAHVSQGCQLGHGSPSSAWLFGGAALALRALRRRPLRRPA